MHSRLARALARTYTCRPSRAVRHALTADRTIHAGVAELVDAPDSKSGSGNRVRVRFSLPAPDNNRRRVLSQATKTFMKYCSSCGALVGQKIPDGDNRHRWVCTACHTVHYQNPKLVVGCVAQRDGQILLCKRSIEPRYGFWTLPAGFMELGETVQQGAARETLEEACAEVRIGRLFASVDVIDAGQVHLFFMADLLSDHQAGAESLDTRLYTETDIPWDSLAFRSGVFALQKYFDDAGRDRGVHHTELRRSAASEFEKSD